MTTQETQRRIDLEPGWREVGAALDWVAAAAQDMGASERQRFAAKLCAEELLANLLRHDETAPAVALTLTGDAERLTLAIEDGGAPFDPSLGPAREALGALDEARPGGWGLALIRRFADDFSYRRSKTGNLVLLTFLP